MANISQTKTAALFLIICLLVGYIAFEKSVIRTELSVPRQPCHCPTANQTPSTKSASVITQSQVTIPPKAATTLSRTSTDALCPTCKLYDLTQENDYPMQCIQMRFTPPAPVCLYPVAKDIHVSGSLARSGTWEAGMVRQYQNWLHSYPDSGVIDVGANLGVYSLVAAAMGRNVVSVEPNIHNIHRFHKAIKQGNLAERIVLFQNAVSDSAGIAKIVYSTNNQGDTQMRKQAGDKGHSMDYDDENEFTKMIVMDDLTPFCKFTDAVMKIDIQGFEHRAFAQAAVLFDKINIHKVMMEWDMMKPIYRKKLMAPEEYALVEKMISFFIDRNYVAKDWNGKVLSRNAWAGWPFDLIWHKT